MGDKVAAKRAMREANVPCVPGSEGALPDNPAALKALAAEIGYPLILKAAGGGGGRGMASCQSGFGPRRRVRPCPRGSTARLR